MCTLRSFLKIENNYLTQTQLAHFHEVSFSLGILLIFSLFLKNIRFIITNDCALKYECSN